MSDLAFPKPTKADRKRQRSSFKLGGLNPLRSKAYRDRVAALPCRVCPRSPAGDPHHPRGLEWGTGGSLKASDEFCIPLCREHHQEWHALTMGPWEAKYGPFTDHVRATRAALGLPMVSLPPQIEQSFRVW